MFEDDVLFAACEVDEDVVEEIYSELKEVVEETEDEVSFTALFLGVGE